MNAALLEVTSYEDVASRFNTRLCDRTCWETSPSRHETGWSTYLTVHWKPRGMTRRGLFNFLRLVADVQWGLHGKRTVERLWMRNTLACEYGLDLGVRFPREWADTDRAHVRALFAAFGHQMAIDPATRRRITRWAQAS